MLFEVQDVSQICECMEGGEQSLDYVMGSTSVGKLALMAEDNLGRLANGSYLVLVVLVFVIQ